MAALSHRPTPTVTWHVGAIPRELDFLKISFYSLRVPIPGPWSKSIALLH